ncbi:MAG: TolC family protein [Sulfurospirillaceae bacterium]|nr:TolC family protein [Sulfurospirillaceae bacterium]
MFILLTSFFLLGGCAKQEPIPTPLPNFNSLSESSEKSIESKWWKEFDDENLNLLIEESLSQNFTLKAAKERILQAQATLKYKNASNLPSINASGGIGLYDEVKGTESKKDTYDASLKASYEVDFLGKRDDIDASATASFLASNEAMQSVAISIVSELSTAWFTLAQKEESLTLLEEQLHLADKILKIAKLRLESGKNSITDIWQQEQYIKSLLAQKIVLQEDAQAQIRAINILRGKSPISDLALKPKLIATLKPIEVGIPAVKLVNRPDVKQSFYKLQAFNADMSEAIKNQYPSLNVSMGLAVSSLQFSKLLDTIVASAIGALTSTLYDGGAKEALIEKTRSIAQEEAHNYAQTMLKAFGEAQEALRRENMQILYIRNIDERLLLADKTFKRQQEKYNYGTTDYLNVLTSQQSLQTLEQTKLSEQLKLIQYRISLYRSLGGGFLNTDTAKETGDTK